MDTNERKIIEVFVGREIGAMPKLSELEGAEFLEKENWENVTGHCLIEAARACVFADLLGFSTQLKKDLALAALLHDGHKKLEIEAIQEEIKNGGSGRAASLAVTKKYLEELATKGVPKRTIELIGFAGGMPEVLFAAKEILDHASLAEDDVAALVMHYVDAYTKNDEWVESSSGNLNDVDRRAKKNKDNPNYKKIGEEIDRILRGQPFFSGMDSFEAMALLSHKIEEKFSELIVQKNGMHIRPFDLPQEIDKILKTGYSH